MRIFGFEIKRLSSTLNNVSGGGGWSYFIGEPYTGAWQRNDELRAKDKLSYFAVFSCMTLIASDISKLKTKLYISDRDGIRRETTSPEISSVLRRPNRYQNEIQFKEWWMLSKLAFGNTYVLKERDSRNVVTAMYIMDPIKTQVLVAPDGEVYYSFGQDDLNNLDESKVFPASEVIHDRMNCLYHPLVGISPMYSSYLAAEQGLTIETDSHNFFKNGARPSGILSAPGAISETTEKRLKSTWETNYGGANKGGVAVIGDDLKFFPMKMTAVDSQLIDQLKWLPTQVCSTFHVPPFKIGVGDIPGDQTVEGLNLIYYTDCLQSHIESMELCLDEGLSLSKNMSVELDLDGLIRMDSKTQYEILGTGVKNMLLAPNEARNRLNLADKPGGDEIWLQQQNWPMGQLAQRNAPDEEPLQEEPDVIDENSAKMLALCLTKELTTSEI